ncbi:MAG: inositol monophosphatase family protein [Desulfonauticus sp.]|nr:inositol monophosphatase family protein [Desulfonauticus sp.]
MLNCQQIQKIKEFILQAGEIIQSKWSVPRNINYKGSIDLVTDTDLVVEKFLLNKIKEICPDVNFIAEETQHNLLTEKPTFIVDPLDGTTNFTHQFPFVAISLAYVENKTVKIGWTHIPILNELFFAQRGKGAYLNDKPIEVSKISSLQQSLIGTGFPYNISEEIDYILPLLKKVLLSSQGVRRAGAAAIDLAYTACGRLDGFYEIGLKPWDTAAGWLLIEEAGGKVSTFNGSTYQLGQREILASNGYIHQDLVKILST